MDLGLKDKVAVVGGEQGAGPGVRGGPGRGRSQADEVGRLGDPRELGYLVAFLASGKSGYITGTTILVDGGLVRSVL
jgi:3-oxoacyl-[acyl-carrier protein] reductase